MRALKGIADVWPRHLADCSPQGDDACMLGGKQRVGGNAPLQGQGGRRVELAIDQGMDHEVHSLRILGQSVVARAHDALPRSEINRPRALASRDMTVPIGTPSIVAISL